MHKVSSFHLCFITLMPKKKKSSWGSPINLTDMKPTGNGGFYSFSFLKECLLLERSITGV